MSAVLDLAPAPLAPAGGFAWPDDVVFGTARQGRIDQQGPKPMRAAEDFVVAVGFDWHLPAPIRHALKAATAELVDNAVRHATWPCGMHVIPVNVALRADHVVLEVRDPDPGLPVVPAPEGALELLQQALLDPNVTAAQMEDIPHGLAYLSGLCDSLTAEREAFGKVMRATFTLPGTRDDAGADPRANTQFGALR